MDSKFVFTNSTDWIDFESDEFLICPAANLIVNNGFIALTKYHPIALLMIEAIITNVQSRVYTEFPLAITGPHLVRQVLLETKSLSYENSRCFGITPGDKKEGRWAIFSTVGNPISSTEVIVANPVKNDDTHYKMKNCVGCNDY